MIDVDSFLAEVAENRRRAQSAVRVGSQFVADNCDLPPALDLILQKGGLIQPQLARSPFAPRSSRVGVPSAERTQAECWWRCYAEDANWLLDTRASAMLVIEFSVYATPCNLFRRAGEYRMLERTLRYGTSKRTFALFSIPPGRSMCRGWYSGVHWRTSVLMPPSRASWELDCEQEFEYSYLDASVPLLPAPETLLGSPVQYF